MVFKATNLISEAFDRHDIKYRVSEIGEQLSFADAAFNVSGGPEVHVHFISTDDNNSVSVRIFGLVHKIPQTKRAAILEACNKVNSTMRFLKFYVDTDGDVIGQYDFLVNTHEDGLGESCFELFVRIMQIVNDVYHIFPEALYGEKTEKKEALLDALHALQDLRDNPVPLIPSSAASPPPFRRTDNHP